MMEPKPLSKEVREIIESTINRGDEPTTLQVQALLAAEKFWREKAAKYPPQKANSGACVYCGVKVFLSDEGEWLSRHATDCAWQLEQSESTW